MQFSDSKNHHPVVLHGDTPSQGQGLSQSFASGGYDLHCLIILSFDTNVGLFEVDIFLFARIISSMLGISLAKNGGFEHVFGPFFLLNITKL
jgi:hypothetical protein